MAFMDFVKKQFIDIIQWTEDQDGMLAYRFPMQDFEIQYGASLTVRDTQMAVFVNEGNIADVFAPGRYKLTTQTLPVLTYLNHWDKLFESPFKSDVYFFTTRIQLDRKWGTPNPVTVRDKDFGMVSLRAFGIYSYRITDAKQFYKQVSGTRESYTTEELEGQLRNTIVTGISDIFGESGVPFIDMASNQEEMGRALTAKLEPVLQNLGLGLETLMVQNISLPEELQKMLDARIGVNMMGGMQGFTQYQVANAIPLAAKNEGGLAGLGAGVGVGFGVGQQMAQSMSQALAPQGAQAQSAPQPASPDEVVETLEKLHALVGKGILSQAEFEAKKAELLKKLT
ncbi:MAG: SPFH domain-containing protein [Betaproteobacteria bacterium]|nr:SPFH domain-containing protein [Betaproteobacteria bacterium]